MFSSIIPDPDVLLSFEPEELAGILLEYLHSLPPEFQIQKLEKHILCGKFCIEGYPKDRKEEIGKALMESWVWLENEGFIAPRPKHLSGFCFITRRGNRIKNSQDLEVFRNSNLLPKKRLHPIIAQKTWSSFVRGEYDTAVFIAFKEVEILVRAMGKFQDTDIGVDLMRKAFNSKNGPLANKDLPEAEKEAMAHLFSGSIGLYKNPGSHREVVIKEAFEAVELIILASRLMKIIDTTGLKPEV